MQADERDAGRLDDLPDQELREMDSGGETILLFRDGATVHAVSGTCPHAGAPLAQGVRHGSTIVCPWHKASFCLRTGALVEPPAVDGLTRHDVRIEAGRILLRTPGPIAAPAVRSDDRRCFVIAGAGAAGAVAAQTLRELGFRGRVRLLDRDNRVPYDRTVLSKYAISGERGGEKTPLQSQAYYRRHDIERVTAEIVAIDPMARRITCADGTIHAYDAALLAPGGIPRRPDLPGADLDGVFLLRGRRDAERLLAQAERSERAVVLGASFIGMEVAASLRERGLAVTVVGRDRVPFEKQLGAQIGACFIDLHQRRGVAFRLGSDVAAIEANRGEKLVRLTSGECLPTDLVVIGAGVEPATRQIAGLTLLQDGGVAVDARLRITDGLYAAGDVARFPLYGDGERIRVEHWRVAQQHGRIAAHNMMGQDIRYVAAPVFWTIQYLKRLDYIGHATGWDDIIVHGDLNEPRFLAYYVRHGRVIAACGLGRDRDTAALAELLTMRRDWTPEQLGDTPVARLSRPQSD